MNTQNEQIQEWKLVQAVTPSALEWKINKMALDGWSTQGAMTIIYSKNPYGEMKTIYSQAIIRTTSRMQLEETVAWLEHSLSEIEKKEILEI